MDNNKQNILKRILPARLTAKKLGKLGGRPRKIDPNNVKLIYDLYSTTNIPV